MSGHYASTGGRNVNPSWSEFVEHQADLERTERAASRESQPTFLPPSSIATSVAQFTEKYDQWMAKRLGKTVEELRAGRAEFKATEAAKKTAKEFEASIEIEIVEADAK